MCGRYANHVEAMQAWADILGDWPADLPTGYNVAPTQPVPVLTPQGWQASRWGLIPGWAKEISGKYATFNARLESVASKPSFRSAWRRGQRCLIPALGYYEWRDDHGVRQPWFVHDADGNPLVFAGLWDRHESQSGSLHSCTVITRPANTRMSDLHDRMPVMLTPDQGIEWLSPDCRDPDGLCQDDQVVTSFHPVSRAVNNARHQGADLIQPVSLQT